MGLPRHSPSPILLAGSPPPIVLTDWLKALQAFQLSYYQLQRYNTHQSTKAALSSFISQCPPREVTQLLERMEQELGALTVELTHPSALSDLLIHTVRLRSLTNQAAVLVSLSSQSTG